MTMINTLRRRRSVPVKLFYAYWRDAHVQIACRLPGIHSLWIHRVEYDEGALWPAVTGVERFVPEPMRFDGIPEPTFFAAEDIGRFVTHMAPLMADERIFMEETISYQSHGSRTVVDRLDDPAPRGNQDVLRMMVFFRAAAGVSADEFRTWVSDDFAPTLAASPEVLKVRQHLLEPYDDTEVVLDAGAEEVSHSKPTEDQYQAVLEVVVGDRLALARLAASDLWRDTVPSQQTMLRAAHAYQASRTYCMRFNGELTTAGLRTVAVAELIAQLGAANQLAPDARHLVETGRPIGT